MKSWESIPGWMDFGEVYIEAVASFPSGSVFVEVGNYLGRSLCFLGEQVKKSGKDIRVVGVDTCLGSGEEDGKDHHADALIAGSGSLAGLLHRNVVECGLADVVTLIVSSSDRAAKLFLDNSLDFVFLDARHDESSVSADIAAWLPKVRCGGVLAGDDMGVPDEENPVWPGVKAAVTRLLPGFEYRPHDAWFYKKR